MAAAGIAVVIPARDEEARIRSCLESVAAAVRALQQGSPARIPVDVVVVADACVDATAQIARESGASVIEISARRVGTARRVGVDALLAGARASGGPSWIASTDADSRVPVGWLLEHAAAERAGIDLLIGTVRPTFDELPAGFAAAWRSTHTPGAPNGHVHGANLGVRVSAYEEAGGYRDQAAHEDVDLVRRLRMIGARELHSDRAEVITSGRLVGRAPDGYAEHLRALAAAQTTTDVVQTRYA